MKKKDRYYKTILVMGFLGAAALFFAATSIRETIEWHHKYEENKERNRDLSNTLKVVKSKESNLSESLPRLRNYKESFGNEFEKFEKEEDLISSIQQIAAKNNVYPCIPNKQSEKDCIEMELKGSWENLMNCLLQTESLFAQVKIESTQWTTMGGDSVMLIVKIRYFQGKA